MELLTTKTINKYINQIKLQNESYIRNYIDGLKCTLEADQFLIFADPYEEKTLNNIKRIHEDFYTSSASEYHKLLKTIAHKQFLRNHIKPPSIQSEYSFYKFNKSYIVLTHDLYRKIPNRKDILDLLDRAKTIAGPNIKIDTNDTKNELMYLFIGLLLNTDYQIDTTTIYTYSLTKPTITDGYLTLAINDKQIIVLDEDNNAINPYDYLPQKFIEKFKYRFYAHYKYD